MIKHKSIRERIAKLDFSTAPSTHDVRDAIKRYTRTDDYFFTAMHKLCNSEPEMYNYITDANARPSFCHINAENYAKLIGGKCITTWRVMLTQPDDPGDRPLMWHHGVVDLQQHMLVEAPNGTLYCTTPDDQWNRFTPKFGFVFRDPTLRTDASKFQALRHCSKTNTLVHTWGPNILYHPLECKYFNNKDITFQQRQTAQTWLGNLVSRRSQYVFKTI